MTNLGAVLQLFAAMLATLRACALSSSPRWTAPGFTWPRASNDNVVKPSFEPWFLSLVLWIDIANDWTNRFVNKHLPAPGGPPLAGLARAGAHVGLAMYAAWICGILCFVGWLARHRLPRYGVESAAIVWVSFVVVNVLFYREVRGDLALRMLGALHVIAFVSELPCLIVYAKSGRKKLTTERICAVWLVFLGLAAGVGPLRPWETGSIDRVAAEALMGAAMTAMYASIIITILARGAAWFSSSLRCGLSRSRHSR